MALIIKENNNVFKVEGVINAGTAKNFQSHFELLLNVYGDLIIDIDNVSEIDANGINAIKALYNNASLNNKDFFIVGNGCKEISDELRYTVAAA